jgi:hypothetical protein
MIRNSNGSFRYNCHCEYLAKLKRSSLWLRGGHGKQKPLLERPALRQSSVEERAAIDYFVLVRNAQPGKEINSHLVDLSQR